MDTMSSGGHAEENVWKLAQDSVKKKASAAILLIGADCTQYEEMKNCFFKKYCHGQQQLSKVD